MARFELPQRQIHLDFHTGPAIPDVGAAFDAKAFARTMKKAHVNSVTVFAKCHHGHLYYKTDHPARHPSLPKRLDLLGQQVEALHREGIRAPIYISVQCDEYAANHYPQWLCRTPEGKTVGAGPLQAGWQILDMSSPYQDYLAEQIEDVLDRFAPLDGVFFDMCWDQVSVSQWAKATMLAMGLNPEKADDQANYAHQIVQVYRQRYAALVRRRSPRASIYFNSRPLTYLGEDLEDMTHVEIEALPTGGWGYMYFPKNVRFARTFGRPYMGMTARFHKSWADFGGLKPEAALRYEVTQMLAHGGACSIGDQLHPRGTLDAAAYEMIGNVYGYAQQCEPWTDGAAAVAQIGLFQAGAGHSYHDPAGGTNDGATRMLTQLKHQFDVVNPQSELEKYPLLILPDEVTIDAALTRRLRAYVKQGGSLLLSGSSGEDPAGKGGLTSQDTGVRCAGESPFGTTYIRFGPEIAAGVARIDHVMYERGRRLKATAGGKALARVVEPYFERNYQHFSSHFQTPPKPQVSPWAAAIQKGRIITIAYPIFRAFGQHANLPYRQLVSNCIDRLLPQRLLRVAGPSTLEASVMRQGRRTIVHLLQFVAERRTTHLDLVEDIVPLHDVDLTLRLARQPKRVYLAPSDDDVPFTWADGAAQLRVPKVTGHQMVVFE